jgi:hypothetical protein
MRTQQRMMLYHYMVTSERQVPSTSGAIFEALHREHTTEEAPAGRKTDIHTREQRASKPVAAASSSAPVPLYARSSQHHRVFQNALTLATVAAVILAAIGLLNRFVVQSSAPSPASTSTSHPNQTPGPGSATNNDGWNSVLFGLTVFSAAGLVQQAAFYSYNTSSSQMTTLMSTTQALSTVTMEGVSDDGQSLLFDETLPSKQKIYKTYSPATSFQNVYQVAAGQSGNAVWMDMTHILVPNISGGVQELNTQTRALQRSWALKTGRLTFYRQPFLYFIGAKNLETDALYRANLSQANPTPNTRFWLSIDGTTVFYANHGSSGVQGIYAVGSDGTNFRLLRKGPALPIGYADDNALMVLVQEQDKFQVIKLGATAKEKDATIIADAAPGAISLCTPPDLVTVVKTCDQNIALAPYGYGLLLHAYYSDGTTRLIYDNLDKGLSRTIRFLPASTSVQLPGWSKMVVSTTAAQGRKAA